MSSCLNPLVLAIVVCLVMTACATTTQPGVPTGWGSGTTSEPRPAAEPGSTQPTPLQSGAVAPQVEPFIQRGTGNVVGEAEPAPARTTADGDITLNFDATPIADVAAIILGDYLGQTYTVDPAVEGEVTFRGPEGLSRDDLLPMLETLLASKGAALIRDDSGYRVVPMDRARALANTGMIDDSVAGSGYRSVVIPLKFISATDMADVVSSYGVQPIVNEDRNVIVVSGTTGQIQQIRQLVETFDVNWLEGMSIALHPLRYADASDLENELSAVFATGRPDGAEDGAEGAARVVSIERLNALLVIAPHPDLLEEYGRWIDRLDRVSGKGGRSLYVYHVQNGRAEDLARVLSDVFLSRRLDASPEGALYGDAPVDTEMMAPLPEDAEHGSGAGDRLRVIADAANNALLILADQQDYAVIEAALRQLDVAPRQVLIEASIIEVRLSDDLRYGLEWLIRGRTDDYVGDAILDFGDPGLAAINPGFSYILRKSDEVRLAINALAEDAQINVLSSPSLLVLNNQTATIRVGDEVPIPTRQSVSNIDPTAPTVNEIEYRNTGVLLAVTPRLNRNGLVTMDIDQEVSNVSETTSSDIDAPTFLQRHISSSVAINSGETVVLGGLIREQRSSNESGVPVLYKIPVLGKLFGTTTRSTLRTELIVLITPRGINEPRDMRAITDEYQRKMMGLTPALEGAPGAELEGAPEAEAGDSG